MAERQGFEPWVPLPARRISSAVLSTTQPPLRRGFAHVTSLQLVKKGALSPSRPACQEPFGFAVLHAQNCRHSDACSSGRAALKSGLWL
jgi:hypothetical protein